MNPSSLDPLIQDLATAAHCVKLAHWNVTGCDHLLLHRFYGEVYDTVTKHLDTIAERARAIGLMAVTAVSVEAPASFTAGGDMLRPVIDVLAIARGRIEGLLEEADRVTENSLIEASHDIAFTIFQLQTMLDGEKEEEAEEAEEAEEHA